MQGIRARRVITQVGDFKAVPWRANKQGEEASAGLVTPHSAIGPAASKADLMSADTEIVPIVSKFPFWNPLPSGMGRKEGMARQSHP
jgi:hypothetical protein